MSVCSEDGCGDHILAGGLCNKHYKVAYRAKNGDRLRDQERRTYWDDPEKFRARSRVKMRIAKKLAREKKLAKLLTAEVRTILRFPGFLFRVDGEVIGMRLCLLKGRVVSNYRKVGLSCFGEFFLSRLICEAFHGPAPSKWHQAAHLDGNSRNNAASNLAWKTCSENELDKRRHGTAALGERNGFTNLTTTAVLSMRALRSDGASYRNIAKCYGVSKSTAFNVCSGNTWGHV